MSNPLVNTPIIDKNGVATSRNKKIDGAAPVNNRVANAPSATTASEQRKSDPEYNDYLDDFESNVDKYVRNGLLKTARAFNGDIRYETPEILIGRNSEGGRVYAKISVEHIDKARTTVDGEVVEESWDVSFTGSTKNKGSANFSSGGQIYDEIANIVDGVGSENAAEFAEIWKRNHLNGLNAGTTKQQVLVDSIRALNPDAPYDYTEISKQVPDDNGYKYGSSWLHRNASIEDVDKALSLLSSARYDGSIK